jgi:hypothetical protein
VADVFGWYSKKHLAQGAEKRPLGGFAGPDVILNELKKRVPQYLDEADQGKLIYPACKRTLSDRNGDVGFVWDHTRLEAIRYVMMVPGREFELLSRPARQMEVINAYLSQRPHAETVIDFTGTAAADFAIAILAGLNWLTYCAQLARVPPSQQSGTIRDFRKVVTLAQRWWLMEGAADRCAELLASGKPPPLMFYLVWSQYTRLAKQITAAAIFGSSISRSTKLVVLPADLITRFEAAQDPNDLLGT